MITICQILLEISFMIYMRLLIVAVSNWQYKILFYKYIIIYHIIFADCLGRLFEKSSNTAHAKRLKELTKGVEENSKGRHCCFFKKWMINVDKEVKIMSYTLLCTSYILYTVSLKPYADGLIVFCLVSNSTCVYERICLIW